MDSSDYWDNRSKKYKTDIRGVLFKKPYPQFVNKWFHSWTTSIVDDLINKYRVKLLLDIGCGYGRLAIDIAKKNKRLVLDGVDFSRIYVGFYNKNLKGRGRAYLANMLKLPFKQNKYDMVIVIATLMYLASKEDQQKAVNEMNRVAKRNGIILLIERTGLMQLLDPKVLFKKGKFTKQVSFTEVYINNLLEQSSARLVSKYSWPLKPLPLFIAYEIRCGQAS